MNSATFYLVIALLMFGVNNAIWALVGGIRWLSEAAAGANPARRRAALVPRESEVAVLMAAHNEAEVIGASIASAANLVPAERIFVVSDGSSDDTVTLARGAGAQVLDLQPNRGKAGALAAGVDHFGLATRFAVVLILDADTELDSEYLSSGLPLFADPAVAVVAGRATTQWRLAGLRLGGRLLLMHRERVYAVVQWLVKYGQGHAAMDAVSIAPGFASMYRARVLRSVRMNPPGLVIEDFNMTFEIHRHRLGRIAFHPRAAIARTQDPVALREYQRQVRRWALGFWQTVRLHRPWHLGLFWWALVLYCLELVVSAITLLASAAAITLLLIAGVITALGVPMLFPGWTPSVESLLIAILAPDLVLTCAVAAGQRRPGFLLGAPVYPLLRVLDSWVCLSTLACSTRARSTGRWTSPTRRSTALPAAPAAQPR